MHLHADSARCSGCRACQLACSLHLFGENNPKKAAIGIIPHFPQPGTFEVKTCKQCGTCAEVCPVEAIHKNERDAYYINSEECIACEACVEECPEGVIFMHADYETPFECDLCGDCIEVCGMKALWIE